MEQGVTCHSANIYDLFQLPLSEITHEQLHELEEELDSLDHTDENDT